MSEAIELLNAAMGNEGDMVHCFEVNGYSGEIPQGNETKRIELIRLALALLAKPKCKTCGGSGKKLTAAPNLQRIPCPRCKGTGIEPEPEQGELSIAEIIAGLNTCNARKDGSHRPRNFQIEELVNKLQTQWVKFQALLDSQQAEMRRLTKEKKILWGIALEVRCDTDIQQALSEDK